MVSEDHTQECVFSEGLQGHPGCRLRVLERLVAEVVAALAPEIGVCSVRWEGSGTTEVSSAAAVATGFRVLGLEFRVEGLGGAIFQHLQSPL